MAAIDARLTREIRESGAAGAIVFAWLDEWFKKNWVVIDYEIPLDNTRLWHNVMDAEQNYGILGMYAGEAGTTPRLGGDPARWRALPAVQRSADTVPRGSRDASGPERTSPSIIWRWSSPRGDSPGTTLGIQLALDTHLPRVGQHRLPRSGCRVKMGFEFLVDLARPDQAGSG